MANERRRKRELERARDERDKKRIIAIRDELEGACFIRDDTAHPRINMALRIIMALDRIDA